MKDLQINLPRTLALMHVGATSYITLIDPKVRNSHQSLRTKISHWAAANSGIRKFMPILTFSALAASVNAWRITKDTNWLLGGAAIFSIIPYSLLFMSK